MRNGEVYSLGHSNLSMEQFISFLKALDVENLIDVRSNPFSIHVPHFNKENLKSVLEDNNIQYNYCGDELGGRQDRQFKDYIYTSDYQEAIKSIERIIDNSGKSAIMCSENDYKRCHRRYISDTLMSHGYNVVHVKYDKNKSLGKQAPLGEINEMKTIYTIGYTKKSLKEFVSLLKEHNIEKIVDIRLKNTSQIAGFAKANDLEYILEELLGIKYLYEPELSPTEEILKKYKEDKNWEEYVKSFTKLMKDREIDKTVKRVISDTDRVCLLCSEDPPDNCHRRLVAEYYKEFDNSIKIRHLTSKDLGKANRKRKHRSFKNDPSQMKIT